MVEEGYVTNDCGETGSAVGQGGGEAPTFPLNCRVPTDSVDEQVVDEDSVYDIDDFTNFGASVLIFVGDEDIDFESDVVLDDKAEPSSNIRLLQNFYDGSEDNRLLTQPEVEA
nr:hypothetical protein HmN_000962900 [Hymenolepis microstoma]